MARYSLHSDISFVTDHNKLIVLNFETGEYFTVDGICKYLLEELGKSCKDEEQLLHLMNEIYDSSEYNLEESLTDALIALYEVGFVIKNE